VGRATYLRRRLAAAVMVVAVVLVTAQAGAALGGSTHEAPGRAPTFAQVTVRPGDSLWSVAERLVPGEDPRPVVDALSEARRGAPLLPGETVRWAG
jgi:Tfp pilus assembly protein FimV